MNKSLVIVNSRVLNLRVILEQFTHSFSLPNFFITNPLLLPQSITFCSSYHTIFFQNTEETITLHINENDYFAPKTLLNH